jgi:hypothetical protein
MPIMRRCVAAVLLALAVSHLPVDARADALAAARQAYNAGDYATAIENARTASEDPRQVIEARIILGRALLERFRQSGERDDLASGRQALLEAGAQPLSGNLRAEWLVGSAEALFFEGQFGAAATLFTSLIDDPRAASAVPGGRERLLDWWATAADRAAQAHDGEEPRREAYQEIDSRLQRELERDPSLGTAAYWHVVAARGAGDLERAWNAAMAAWVRAPLSHDRGAQLRADLDRIMMQAIIPERARLAGKEQTVRAAALHNEWEEFKKRWSIGSW